MLKNFKQSLTQVVPLFCMEKPVKKTIPYQSKEVNGETGLEEVLNKERQAFTLKGIIISDEFDGFQAMGVSIGATGYGDRIDAMSVMELFIENKEALVKGEKYFNCTIELALRGKDGEAFGFYPVLKSIDVVCSTDEDKAFIQKYLGPAKNTDKL
jgi:hypothetical protein